MDQDELLRIHSILHLIFHRNKNQHRGTDWWKWLSMLKRTVWNLAESLSLSKQRNLTSLMEAHKRRLADNIVPRCYVAFSVVAADVQFSPLGTVLIATLARLSKSAGINKELKSRPLIGTCPRKPLPCIGTVSSKGNMEDLGEALSRDDEAISSTEIPQTAVVTTHKLGLTKDLERAKTKKKKRRKNAIDDLFDGLL
ncbi:hypothetical protein BJY04DRAFT_197421 [Aspergillus karnatakaensis]|uniref:uncharacterized protein n=1 Tax=Aspergillus karnatakaensis TaxID=1810916 RepID=UPI003CCE157F